MAGKELAVQGKLLDISLEEGVTPAEAMRVVEGLCASLYKAETSVERTRMVLGNVLADGFRRA